VLSTAVDICRSTPTVDSTFVSQNDVSRTVSSRAVVRGCPSLKGSATLSGVKRKRPKLKLSVTSLAALRELRVGLPKQLRPAAAKRLRKRTRVTADGKRLKSATVRWSKGRLVIGKLRGARKVQVSLGAGALRQVGKLKAGRTLSFSIAGVDTKGAAKSAKVRTKAKR
jgi:hypothetical protein